MLRFIDKAHQTFYEQQMMAFHVSPDDREYGSLFYTLGLLPDTRTHFPELFNHIGIQPESLHLPFQTSSTKAITRLAFTLYNGFEETTWRTLSDCQIKGDTFHIHDLDSISVEFNRPANLISLFWSVDFRLRAFMLDAIAYRVGVLDL